MIIKQGRSGLRCYLCAESITEEEQCVHTQAWGYPRTTHLLCEYVYRKHIQAFRNTGFTKTIIRMKQLLPEEKVDVREMITFIQSIGSKE